MARTRNNRRRSSASKILNSAPAIAPKSGFARGQSSCDGTQCREDNYQGHAEEDEAVQNPLLQNQENSNEAMSAMMDAFQPLVQVIQQELQDRRVEEEERVKDRKLDDFLSHSPPKFNGEPDAQKADAWIVKVNRIFGVMSCDEGEQLEYAIFLLEGVANNWWRLLEQRWNANHTPGTWTNFMEEFRDKFVPQVVRDSWEKEFMNLIQGSRSVFEYATEFNRLVRCAPHIMTDERRKTRHFIQGLQPEIRLALVAADIKEYSEAVNISRTVEAEIQVIEQITSKPNEVENTESGGCNYCGHISHTETNCWRKLGRCIACGSDQHMINSCPKAQSRSENRKRKAQAQLAGKPKVEARAYAFEG